LTAVQPTRAATEAEPEAGCASLSIDGRRIMLSEGERWMEADGHHVIRSLEFDVIAAGESFEAALSTFIDSLFDFALYLGQLEDPAENEEEMFHRLAPRVLEVTRELERSLESQRRRPITVNFKLPLLGTKRETPREWHPLSRPLGSQQPSLA
jgi:hypothetical protein